MTYDDLIAELAARNLLADIERIAKEHHVLLEELLSRDRTKPIAAARHAAWRWLREKDETRWSYPAIGNLFGVDHTTVMSAVKPRDRSKYVARPRHAVAPSTEEQPKPIAATRVSWPHMSTPEQIEAALLRARTSRCA